MRFIHHIDPFDSDALGAIATALESSFNEDLENRVVGFVLIVHKTDGSETRIVTNGDQVSAAGLLVGALEALSSPALSEGSC